MARTMEIAKKRTKSQAKEDRISDLPDQIIQHILSFFPSTKKSIQTGILSKRWRNQWTHVPVLIFVPPTRGMSSENFLKFIGKTIILHDCSKINKFYLKYDYCDKNKDRTFDAEIRFALDNHVDELCLSTITIDELLQKRRRLNNCSFIQLPKFLFNNANSLVKLTAVGCNFIPDGKVNWERLTVLSMDNCKLMDEAMKHILSGSPLLESLELRSYHEFRNLEIVSEKLKRLVLQLNHHRESKISVLEISCPNLKELSLDNVQMDDPKSFAEAIKNVLSTSPLLESIELIRPNFGMLGLLVVASKFMKRLVLSSTHNIFHIEISCPCIEELEISGSLNVITAYKLLNLPSSLCPTIDFSHCGNTEDIDKSSTIEIHKSLVNDILFELHNVKELKIGQWFLELLSISEAEDLFSPLLNLKCLTLNSPDFKSYSAIAYLIRNAPTLEKLVINVLDYDKKYIDEPELCDTVKSFLDSNATIFNCLLSHIKTIKIIGFPKKYGNRKLMLIVIQFLLNNARLLEKFVVVLKDHGVASQNKLSQELLSLTRYSRCSTVEVIG